MVWHGIQQLSKLARGEEIAALKTIRRIRRVHQQHHFIPTLELRTPLSRVKTVVALSIEP